jgi:two-component system sensor histidine kinase/response regulator
VSDCQRCLAPDQERYLRLARTAQRDRAFRGIPLILLTAFDERGQAGQALAAGFSAYLVKPLHREQLNASIRTVLAKQRNTTAPHGSLTAGGAASASALRPDGKLAPDEPAQQAIGDQVEPESAPPCRLILLAEDNPANRKVAELQIKKLGFAVEVVGNRGTAGRLWTLTCGTLTHIM